MVSVRVLHSALSDLKKITYAEFALYNKDGKLITSTYEKHVKPKELDVFIKSGATSEEADSIYYYMIEKSDEKLYLLVDAGNGDGYMIGRICVSEILHLYNAYKEKMPLEEFYRDLLLERMVPATVEKLSEELKIKINVTRAVFCIGCGKGIINETKEIVSNMFCEENGDFCFVNDEYVFLIKKTEEALLQQTAELIVSTVNTELFIPNTVTYGNPVSSLQDLSESYRQAMTAMKIVEIFSIDRNAVSYSSLGIGRIVYEMPDRLCSSFIQEIFNSDASYLTREDEQLVNKFLDNDLSVADTSRELEIPRSTLIYHIDKLKKVTGLDIRHFEDAMTLKLALMINKYIQTKKDL